MVRELFLDCGTFNGACPSPLIMPMRRPRSNPRLEVENGARRSDGDLLQLVQKVFDGTPPANSALHDNEHPIGLLAAYKGPTAKGEGRRIDNHQIVQTAGLIQRIPKPGRIACRALVWS